MQINKSFQKLYNIVAKLRGQGGCPWDIEQTPQSLREDLLEETFECIEAINEKNSMHIKEELGDLFLLVTMISYMHEQEGLFKITEVLDSVSEKLIRRHPHVFGDKKFNNSAEVLENWSKIKIEQEGRKPKDSILDSVSSGLPQMERAYKLQKKAAKAGFDWPDSGGVKTKILEELEEVMEAAKNIEKTSSGSPAWESAASYDTNSKLEEELGDLLFSVINLCRFFNINPSDALMRTNKKFYERFKYVEKQMKNNNHELKAENLALMDQYWNEAKKK